NCAAAVERPAVTLRREDDRRAEEPAREWHLRVFTANEARGLFELEPIGDFPEGVHPVLRLEGPRSANNPSDGHCAKRKPAIEQHCDSCPDPEQKLRIAENAE